MASEGDAAEGVGQESVVLASFENRHAAEHMLLPQSTLPPASVGFFPTSPPASSGAIGRCSW